MSYTELQVTTNFSFLRGAAHPEELVKRALELQHTEIAITDRNTLAGIVRAYAASKEAPIRVIPGCRLDLLDGPSLLAYPVNQQAYARLSSMLSTGNLRAEKGQCHLYQEDVFANARDMKFIAIAPSYLDAQFNFDPAFVKDLERYKDVFGKDLYLAITRTYQEEEDKILFRLQQLGRRLEVPLVATNDVHYHIPERRELQDVLTCIREKCTIYEAGFRLFENGERYLKKIAEMQRLFRQYPDAIKCTKEIAEACHFSLNELKYVYPEEITSLGRSPQEALAEETYKGAQKRYPGGVPQKIKDSIAHELRFIEEMGYAPYFLTVYDIVNEANRLNILCQGRGSAANSAVCYCLGITAVNPMEFELLFERFISAARNEPPDIDVDFEHERREEIMQYIYNKYGRDRAAIVATVTQMHTKGAIRDVGKVMGLSVDTIGKLAASVWHFTEEWFDEKRLVEQGLNPHDQHLRKVLQLTGQYIGFPRQLGQHTGGFVITQGKLTELCPVLNARMEDRTCIEWNKDDIDTLGFLKIDVLALGMLTCIRKCFDLLRDHYNLPLTLATVPTNVTAVYDMICKGDTIGVFQIESRAQQAMLPRLKPREFYDLVIEVAIVRPGPIQGDMVHPYLRRRNELEEVVYPKGLEEILKRTLGVPLFQEQAMKIAIVAADFTPAEADELRRAMATFKAKGVVNKFKTKLIEGMLKNGYEQDFAERIYRQLEGFGSYGFPESHAASFALLVYISSWIKCMHPDVFACGLLNSQPMGFYAPAQIVRDAREHDVVVLPVDVNFSCWDNTLEPQEGKPWHALRLGFRQVKSLGEEALQPLLHARPQRFDTILALHEQGLSVRILEVLADADAFRSMGLDRRQALWEITSLHDRPIALFEGQPSASTFEAPVQLPLMTPSEHVVQDYAAMALSLKAHPVSFVREQLTALQVLSTEDLLALNDGDPLRVAGLVLVKQRPGTASGICFITIEDEKGVSNLVVFQKLFDHYRKEILGAKLLMVEGTMQREGEVRHVVVKRCYNLTYLLRKDAHDVMPGGRNFR
ncbi:error-prone DNA polymerase [Chitinophaga parva]|uniref:DNA-directed DNA polymerase n=1 Tax=Chitinophaga parva TaxID=2169414 RepID=A0A2T7BE29_9BACT|nr:error-prone DNA polymerase [Chitinophaga parva]PUZ23358.1 error-prone DNA polymerase [Chitinophaga parva]